MNILKKYKAVIALLLPLLILIFFRLSGPGHFKINAKRWAEPSFMGSNIVTAENLNSIKNKLVINLDPENTLPQGIENAISADPESLLNKTDIIKNHKGPVILFSHETSVSARIWMLLSQMGYKNIFILAGNEVLKYKFRPDSLIRPEL